MDKHKCGEKNQTARQEKADKYFYDLDESVNCSSPGNR